MEDITLPTSLMLMPLQHQGFISIAHSKAGWKIRPPFRTMEVSKYNEKGVLEWMK